MDEAWVEAAAAEGEVAVILRAELVVLLRWQCEFPGRRWKAVEE